MIMRALMRGWNAMKTMWSRGKVTRGVEKMLHQMIIAAMKWMQLTVVFVRNEKTKWGKVKSSTHI